MDLPLPSGTMGAFDNTMDDPCSSNGTMEIHIIVLF